MVVVETLFSVCNEMLPAECVEVPLKRLHPCCIKKYMFGRAAPYLYLVGCVQCLTL